MQPEQRNALLAAKLRALVVEGWRRDASALTARPFPAGASVLDPTDHAGWCLVGASQREVDPMDITPDDVAAPKNPRGWLGGAIVWAARNGVTQLHVLLDEVDGNDARRAAFFTDAPTLWHVEGRSKHDVAPTPFEPVAEPDAITELFEEVIVEGGADPVVDHGVLRAEYRGLEVGRVITGEDGVPRLEIGVGKHDRLANAMLGHDRDVLGALRNAVASVRDHRRAHAAAHPANQLVPERWLRDLVLHDPSLIGLAGITLTAVEGTEPVGLKRVTPAIAAGDGVVVACSVGIDLDAVAFGADARARYAPDAELLLVLPEADALASQRLLVDRVANARLVTVPSGWKDLDR